MCGRAHANPRIRRAAHDLTNAATYYEAQRVVQGHGVGPCLHSPLSRTVDAVRLLWDDAPEMSRCRAGLRPTRGPRIGPMIPSGSEPSERKTGSATLEQRGICWR